MTKTFLASAALIAATLPAHAVTVAQWDFEAVTAPASASTSLTGIAASTGTGTAGGVHAGSTTWSTPAGNGSAKSISANTWAVGDYWQFSFSTAGYTDLMLSFDQTSSNTGPRDFKLAYSTDGTNFADFASYVVLPNTTPAWSAGSSSSLYTQTIDLSAVSALDNQASVVVRLIDNSVVSANGGTVATGGTDRIDNFTVTLAPVPEPGTWALMFAGIAVVARIARRRA